MTVKIPVTTVMTVCSRMIVSKPSAALPTISTVMTRKAITLVTSPELQPSWWNTVAVASVASTVSTISQPTLQYPGHQRGQLVALHAERARGTARASARTRACPATATNPTSRKLTTIPISPATHACQNEMPKPST